MPISVTTRQVIPAPPSPSFRALVPLDANRTYLRIKNDTAAFTMYLDTASTFMVNEPNVHVLKPGEVLTLYNEDAANPLWVFSQWQSS
jgi:hypothetical protein